MTSEDVLCSGVRVPDLGCVTVVARVRPYLENEEKECAAYYGQKVHQITSEQTSIEVTEPSSNVTRIFNFKTVLGPEASQKTVFQLDTITDMIDLAVEGYSCVILAYGQTGSGKTFTLSGANSEDPSLREEDCNCGIMQRSFNYLIEQLEYNHDRVTVSISVTFLEIYNECVYDLLREERRPMSIRWDKSKGFHAPGATVYPCKDGLDLFQCMETGFRNRRTASNLINNYSSRSHSVFTIHIESTWKRDSEFNNTSKASEKISTGKLIFVDLAGSERMSYLDDTGIVEETNNINSSLLVLGQCIQALGKLEKNPETQVHVPYRDSLLTKLLADALGGNGITLLIATVSPNPRHIAETINTLRYASMARHIRNRPSSQPNKSGEIQIDHSSTSVAQLQVALEHQKCLNAQLSAQNLQLRQNMFRTNYRSEDRAKSSALTKDFYSNKVSVVGRARDAGESKAEGKDEDAMHFSELYKENADLARENSKLKAMASALRVHLEQLMYSHLLLAPVEQHSGHESNEPPQPNGEEKQSTKTERALNTVRGSIGDGI